MHRPRVSGSGVRKLYEHMCGVGRGGSAQDCGRPTALGRCALSGVCGFYLPRPTGSFGVAFVDSRWREIRACNDNAWGS